MFHFFSWPRLVSCWAMDLNNICRFNKKKTYVSFKFIIHLRGHFRKMLFEKYCWLNPNMTNSYLKNLTKRLCTLFLVYLFTCHYGIHHMCLSQAHHSNSFVEFVHGSFHLQKLNMNSISIKLYISSGTISNHNLN